MDITVVNTEEKFRKIEELHAYKLIARMNDTVFKLGRMQREFIWRSHPDTDEEWL